MTLSESSLLANHRVGMDMGMGRGIHMVVIIVADMGKMVGMVVVIVVMGTPTMVNNDDETMP